MASATPRRITLDNINHTNAALRRTFALLIILMTVAMTTATIAAGAGGPRASASAAIPPRPFAAVDAALRGRVRRDGISGAATVVVGPGDRVLHRFAVGAMRSSTRFPIASASKWLTAAMVMALVDQGRLSLDDRVRKFLPAFRGDKTAMTVRQLLSHTSGLTTAGCVGDPTGTLARCVKSLATDAVLAAPPGREFHYSNDGYQVAGRIIEVLTAVSFERAFEVLIGRPVGMSQTRFDRIGGVHTRNPTPAASAVSTLADYQRFLAMISNGGAVGSHRVLSAASVAEIERDQVHGFDTSGDFAVAITHIPTYGLGVWRDVTDATDNARVVSGNGALGFYPWVDLVNHTYGIVAVNDDRGPELAVPASQRVARREWTIAARLVSNVAPKHPFPVGSIAAGTRSEVWTDTSRTLPANGGAPGAPSRSMLTTIWYPASGAPTPSATSRAPPDRSDGPYPLIVFAHGFAATPGTYAALLSRWASAGYVVVAPALPLLNGDAPGGASHADYGTPNIADLDFALSEALRRSNAPGDALHGLVDPTRVAVAGHSDGEVLAYFLGFAPCCHDARVTSVIAMAGNLDNARQLPAPTGVAILHIMSERDQYNPYTASIVFDRAHLASPRALLTLRGAPHEPPYDEPADPHFAIVVDATVDFLDATVGHRFDGFARLAADATAAGALAAFERS